MPDEFEYDVFLSHSSKDKAVVRPLAERLQKDGLKVWFDEWVLKPGDSIPAKIEEGLEHSRVLVLCMSANAFGSDWTQLESGTFRFRDPLNKERRFLPLRLDDAPIKGSLAQFLYLDWTTDQQLSYSRMLAECRRSSESQSAKRGKDWQSAAETSLILSHYLQRELTRLSRMPMPFLDHGPNVVALPFDAIRIGLPLRLTHECSAKNTRSEMTDVEFVEWLMRESFTSALLWDRAARLDAHVERGCLLGERLEIALRLVVVGDPGCGKTTLLSSITRHYAFRHLSETQQFSPSCDSGFRTNLDKFPDRSWIPLILSCRDLAKASLEGGLAPLIDEQLAKNGHVREGRQGIVQMLTSSLESGNAILLVDGLDEIPGDEKRRSFSKLLTDAAEKWPDTPMIITSRVAGFHSVRSILSDSFDHLNVAPLTAFDKTQFIFAWEKFIREKANVPTLNLAGDLVPQVCHGRRIAKLCENVFALALIVQMKYLDGKIPEHRRDVYRRIVELMVDRQRPGSGPQITVNEMWPHLEHLAYRMRSDGAQKWSEMRVIGALRELRALETREAGLQTREPDVWLSDVIYRVGILNVAGPGEVDALGYERPMIQFFHQSFQEYFASQALYHGRGARDNLGVIERLRKQVYGLAIVERKIETLGSGSSAEPVVAGYWQEVVRLCISELRSGKADDALLMLIPNEHATPSEARGLTVFAMQCVADEPNITEETANAVFDAAVDNVIRLDGFNTKRNTMMDEAIFALASSCWAQAGRRRFLLGYIQSRAVRRNNIGCALMKFYIDAFDSENAIEVLSPLLNTLRESSDVLLRVEAALRLCNAFYTPQGLDAKARIDFLPSLFLRQSIETLLSLATRWSNECDALSTAAIWALSWLTSAKACDTGSAPRLTEAERRSLLKVVADARRDPHARRCAALIVSIRENEAGVFSQVDWIYKWAVVADGAEPQRNQPQPIGTFMYHSEECETLKTLLYSSDVVAAKGAAISLGRLGCFLPQMVDPLLEVFNDDVIYDKERDEALVYLRFCNNDRVIDQLCAGANASKEESDSYGRKDRCFFALIAIGDVEVLKRQLSLGGDPVYVNSYAYALAGVSDDAGLRVLNQMKEHPKEEVRGAVTKALAKAKHWTGS